MKQILLLQDEQLFTSCIASIAAQRMEFSSTSMQLAHIDSQIIVFIPSLETQYLHVLQEAFSPESFVALCAGIACNNEVRAGDILVPSVVFPLASLSQIQVQDSQKLSGVQPRFLDTIEAVGDYDFLQLGITIGAIFASTPIGVPIENDHIPELFHNYAADLAVPGYTAALDVFEQAHLNARVITCALVVQDDLDTQIPADSFAWDVILSTIQVLGGEAPEAFFQSFHADE